MASEIGVSCAIEPIGVKNRHVNEMGLTFLEHLLVVGVVVVNEWRTEFG